MKRALLFAAALAAAIVGSVASGSAAALVATVDVGNQKMTVTRHGQVIYEWDVSTARRGYITPRGEWRPYRQHVMWRSRKYDNAPMPYAVFYHAGYAIHGTTAVGRLGTPASHGCVRLMTSNAKIFHDLVKEIGPGNTRVVVIN
ncbi:MAG: L,D-transpeptidase [Rhizobiaceae bacterium]|nr:L,D-transpeptidase [Rhizobiaceae bacterium]